MPCSLCRPGVAPGGFKPTELDGVVVDANCDGCGSRARTRAFGAHLSSFAGGATGLIVSANGQEQRLYRRSFATVDHVSLLGDHGDPDCRLGVDLMDMPQIETGRYDHVAAIAVLDYIPEPIRALSEVARVLKPGGVFAFVIMPYRLTDDGPAVRVVHRNALRNEAYTGHGAVGVPDCRFNRSEIPGLIEAAGLAPEVVRWPDESGVVTVDLFLARKAA